MLPSLPTSHHSLLKTDFYNLTIKSTSEDYTLGVNMKYGGRFNLVLIASFTVRSNQLRKILDKALHTTSTPLHTQIQMLEKATTNNDLFYRVFSNNPQLLSPIVVEVMSTITRKFDQLSVGTSYTNVKSIRITNEPLPVEIEFNLCKSSMSVQLPFLIEAATTV